MALAGCLLCTGKLCKQMELGEVGMWSAGIINVADERAE